MIRFEMGVDVGGTFTDCVLADRKTGEVYSCKVLTTHDLPSRAIFDGFGRLCEQARIAASQVERFVHTTTLVGNAVIEHRGRRTALIATRGFRDVLHLRREYRYDLFEALIEFPTPLIPRALSFELDERIGAQGEVVQPLDEAQVLALAETLKANRVESVAVCLLHAYANPAHEQRVGELLAQSLPGVTVSLSTRVLPKIREYERTSATAINAYVQPLVATYLDDLAGGLHARGCPAQLLVVTSIGGTVAADTAKALPIQLVESGPAAGVVFAARLGLEQKHHDLVAFDMGGTTAKVCIVRGGTPQVRTDLEVARAKRFKPGSGMPVGVPLFDLLEIGAGGGSVAGIDEAGLVRVGPRSVGSTPGPACYGRGGTEATVTDANLVLGFIDPEALLGGERALDMQAARRAIDTHLAQPLGLSIEAAAEAVIRIVNESMAEALRMRSVESNVDVRRFTMMAFGGGGGLHGVEIARRVGIARVVCPPRAGVFCAAGLLVSPVNVETLRSRIVPLEAVDAVLAQQIFDELEAEARASVATVAGADGDYRIERWVDMSYVGQEYELPVAMPGQPGTAVDHAALEAAFEDAYRGRYGRTLAGFPTRIVTWRLKLVGPSPSLLALRRSDRAAAVGQRRVFMGGRWLQAAIHDRRALAPGAAVAGPAVIQDVDTTLLVPDGAGALCEGDGTLLIDCVQDSKTGRAGEAMTTKDTLDDITLKIIWDRLISVMNEAAETLYRSAFSPLVRESKDGACALLTLGGETLAIGDTALPSFAATQAITLRAVLAKHPLSSWRPGDVMMSNDPWIGPAQVNDCTLLKPVFRGDRLVAFTGSVAHSPDLGGVTRYNGAADVFEEGLQIPMMWLYRGGEPNQTLMDIIAANSRVPQETLGDLNAQLASHDVGERRLLAIMEEYGLDDLQAVSEAILGRTERAMRDAIRAVPDGDYEHAMRADGVPGPLEKNRDIAMPPMALHATVRVRGDELEVDLTKSCDQVEAAINSTHPFTYAYCAYTLRVMLLPSLPQNGGSTRPISVTVREGSVYHARKPAPTMSRAVVGHTVADLIFGALADTLPQRTRGNGGSTPTWVLVLVGRDHQGRPYQRVLPQNGGLGGQQGSDGYVLSFPSNTQNQGVETLEAGTPIRVKCREMISDSGGVGRFRGGVGVRFAVQALQRTVYSLAIGHVHHAPQGVLGGGAGRAGRADVDGRALNPGAEGTLEAGQVLTIETPGGGGFGLAAQREAERAALDRAEGWVGV